MRVVRTIRQSNLRQVPDIARAAEAAGYDSLLTTETAHNPFLPLAVAATVTERIEIATGIAIAFARSPMTVANIGWDLAAATQPTTGSRVAIGLGSQVKGHNERRFSVAWSPPAPRMREYVEALRAIWRCWKTGSKLDYRGAHYSFTLMTPNFTPEPIAADPPALTMAAVGPAMLKVAAEVCDGVRLHGFCTRRYMENVVLPKLEAGLEARGRGRDSFEISGGGFIATGPDEAAVAERFEWVRSRVGFYGSTRLYWPVFEQHDLVDLGQKLYRMSVDGHWDKMAAEVPDDVVHLFAAVGPHDKIAGEIEKRFGGISDTIGTGGEGNQEADFPPDLIQDIQKIPRRFEGYQTAV